MIQTQNSGLDIDLGDACSEVAYQWAKETFPQRAGKHGALNESFEAPFAQTLHFSPHNLAITSDGIGTKIEIAERMGIFHTLGYDLVAMVVDDLVCCGAEPTNLSNILDVDVLDKKMIHELMRGLRSAALEANVAVSGGEIAELGNRISGWGDRMHFNWCATGIGYIINGPIDGKKIKPKDEILALRSRGLRSNGFSIVRKLLEKVHGEDWHEKACCGGRTWGEVLLTPSIIYTPLVMELLKSALDIHAVIHVTGGGICRNLSRLLRPNRLGAELDDLLDPHPFMHELQELGAIDDETAYRLWNMGNGMLLVVDSVDTKRILMIAEQMGFEAQVCGQVKQERSISLQSKGKRPRRIDD